MSGEPDLISQYICQLVKDFGQHPYDINNGNCSEFAQEVETKFPEADGLWDDFEPDLFPNESEVVGHCFIRYKGKYYDAEEPYGVKLPNLLPIYLRKKYQIIA